MPKRAVTLVRNTHGRALKIAKYLSEHKDESKNCDDLLSHMQRVLEAGFWLIENGYGKLSVMPYQGATGAWRCEFHPAGKPARPFFRYSNAQGARYLANHCGGYVTPSIGPEKLASAIMISVSGDAKDTCGGPASNEVLRWIQLARGALAGGSVPSAFGEYYGGRGEPWTLLTGSDKTRLGVLPPMPGCVLPRDQPSPLLVHPWRDGLRRLKDSSGVGGLVLSPRIASDPEVLLEIATKLAYEFSCVEPFDRGPLLAAAIGALQCRAAEAQQLQPPEPPGRVSVAAAADPVVRRGTRLLTMVHELHKAGYQRLRFVSYLTDDGCWAARLFSSSAVAEDGWSPLKGDMIEYDTSDGTGWFGWKDAQKDDARVLADKFVKRFAEAASSCAGEDWAYAGWLSMLLGRAERGELPVFFGLRGNIAGDREPPPPMDISHALDDRSTTTCRLISSRALTSADLPAPYAEYEQLWRFCLSYDGYHAGLQTIDACFAIAEAVLQKAESDRVTLDQLRTAAFILQRRLKHHADFEVIHRDHPDMRSIHDIVEQIRTRLA